MVMFSSFLCNGIIFGTINSYGVLFVYLKDRFKENEVTISAEFFSYAKVLNVVPMLVNSFASAVDEEADNSQFEFVMTNRWNLGTYWT